MVYLTPDFAIALDDISHLLAADALRYGRSIVLVFGKNVRPKVGTRTLVSVFDTLCNHRVSAFCFPYIKLESALAVTQSFASVLHKLKVTSAAIFAKKKNAVNRKQRFKNLQLSLYLLLQSERKRKICVCQTICASDTNDNVI